MWQICHQHSHKGAQTVRIPYCRFAPELQQPAKCFTWCLLSRRRCSFALSLCILLSVCAAGRGFTYAVDVRLHTQHLLHQGRDRKAKPFFQMPSLTFSQNYFLNIQTFCRFLAAIYAFYIPLLGMAALPVAGLDFSQHRKPICSAFFRNMGFGFLAYADVSSTAASLPFCNKCTSSHRSFQSLHALKLSSFLLSLWFVSSLLADLQNTLEI